VQRLVHRFLTPSVSGLAVLMRLFYRLATMFCAGRALNSY
jgi:hypothetical protein